MHKKIKRTQKKKAQISNDGNHTYFYVWFCGVNTFSRFKKPSMILRFDQEYKMQLV
jgi:hypothetical protein